LVFQLPSIDPGKSGKKWKIKKKLRYPTDPAHFWTSKKVVFIYAKNTKCQFLTQGVFFNFFDFFVNPMSFSRWGEKTTSHYYTIYLLSLFLGGVLGWTGKVAKS
jgi:hypothetical protein